jgi:YidC/Oxa1 family membrane protein insertase
MIENRNLILAIVLSAAILFGFEQFFGGFLQKPVDPATEQQATPQTASPAAPGVPGAPGVPQPDSATAPAVPAPAISLPGAASDAVEEKRKAVLENGSRLQIRTPRLRGSIPLVGGRIDDLTLADYHKDINGENGGIVLFSPRGSENPYYADFGWAAMKGIKVPTADVVWQASAQVLTPDAPVTLSWDNGEGLRFERTLSVDENFMFTVKQRVVNSGTEPVSLYSFGLVSRHGTPDTIGYVVLHEGLLGFLGEALEEVDYDDLQEAKNGLIEQQTTGGWLGITDKYWLAALVPDQAGSFKTRFSYRKEDNTDKYQADFQGPETVVAAGGSAEVQSWLFTGAKEVNLLDGYEENLGVKRFDLAIDFGWFYFLTKPIFYTLIYINDHVGNFGISIILLTILIKILFFPLANKSYRSMAKMKKLQPEMLKLRERLGDDKQRLNQEMMALYKREKANPASGCLPMLIQIPVFFSLYKVLFVTIEMRHAPFFGWIQDLSAPDPTSLFNLFGLIPFTPPEFLMIGVWPLIMGISMFLQQKLNPQPADPVQAKVFMFLPLMFTFMLARFPAGLVIYWAWNNILSIIQQWLIMKKAGVK